MKSCLESFGLTRYVPGIMPFYLMSFITNRLQKSDKIHILWEEFDSWIHGGTY